MTTKRIIYKRQVQSFMMFMEDAGGLWASLYFIGAILNGLFGGRDLGLKLLESYFTINISKFKPK